MSHPQGMTVHGSVQPACSTNTALLILAELAVLWGSHMKGHQFFLGGHGQVGYGEHHWSPVHLSQTVCTFLI